MNDTIGCGHKYYEEAQKMLEKNDLIGFVVKAGISMELAGNDRELLAKCTFLMAEGLFRFKQFERALEVIQESQKYNTGQELVRLKNYEGVAYGYLGDINKAQRMFESILNDINDTAFLVEVYLNIAWIHLSLDKDSSKQTNIAIAEKYLSSAFAHFEVISNNLKRKLLNNYSVYYYYLGEYEKAIEYIQDAFQYAEEYELPRLYNNLAEIRLKLDIEGIPLIEEYLDKAEIIASKYNDKLQQGNTFFAKAMLELREGQSLKAIDTLYVAFDFFKDDGAHVYAIDCLLKINEITNDFKNGCLASIKEKLNEKSKCTPLYNNVQKR